MKKLLVFAMTGIMVLGLTACGGGDISYDVDIDDIIDDVDIDDIDDYIEENQGGSEDSEYIPDQDYSELGDENADQGQFGDDVASVYYDTWEADYDPDTFFKFDDLGTWYMWNSRVGLNESGYFEVSDGNLILFDNDGNKVNFITGDDINTIVDQDGGFIHRYDPQNDQSTNYGNPLKDADYPIDWDNDGPLSDIVDTWVYLGYYSKEQKDDTTYIFQEDGSYLHEDANGNVMDWGTYEIDPIGDHYSTDLYLNSELGDQYTFRILFDGDYLIEDQDSYPMFRAKYK